MANNLPEAVTRFLSPGVSSAATLSAFAMGAVVVSDDVRYRGSDAIAEFLSGPSAARSWTVDYAMDTEFVVTTDDNRRLQFLLDCGQIAYLSIEPATVTVAASEELAAA